MKKIISILLLLALLGIETQAQTALATAADLLSMSMNGNYYLTADISVLCVPGHKDTEAGMKNAKRLATALNETVSLTVGVHVDLADQEEISLLLRNMVEAAEAFIREAKAARKQA